MSKRSNLVLHLSIMALFLLTQLTASLYIPILPVLMINFKISKIFMMNAASVFFFGYAIGQLIWGIISDNLGRKNVFLYSLAGYVLFCISITKISTFLEFLIILLMVGFFTAAFTSVGNAYYKDIYKKEVKKILSKVGIIMACGPIISPLISSMLTYSLGWKAIFYFLAIFGVIFFINIFFYMKEDNTMVKTYNFSGKELFDSLLDVFTNNKYTACVLVLGLSFGSFFAYFNALPFILIHDLGFSMNKFALIAFSTTLSFLIGTIINMYLIKKQSPVISMRTGLILSLSGISMALVFEITHHQGISPIFFGLALSILGLGMIIPAAKSEAMSITNVKAGLAASLMKFIQTILCVIVMSISAHISKTNTFASLLVMMFCTMALSFVILASAYSMRINKHNRITQ